MTINDKYLTPESLVTSLLTEGILCSSLSDGEGISFEAPTESEPDW